MNSNPSLNPETSLLAQKSQGRGRVKIAVFTVLAVHVAGLMALLMTQGCKRDSHQDNLPPEPTNAAPALDPNALPPMDPSPTNQPGGAVVQPPIAPLTPPVVPVPTTTEYIVKQGDNFSTIAKAYNTTPAAIQAANPGVDSRKLKIGQKLVLPPPSAAPAPDALVVAPASGETIHTVKSGETLLRIASHYGTKVAAIKSLNGLTTDQIKVGQKLKIPAKPAPVPMTPEPVPTAVPVTPEAPLPAAPPVAPPPR